MEHRTWNMEQESPAANFKLRKARIPDSAGIGTRKHVIRHGEWKMRHRKRDKFNKSEIRISKYEIPIVSRYKKPRPGSGRGILLF